MNILGAVIVLAFVTLGSLTILYLIARRELHHLENDKRDYQQLVNNLDMLETRMQDEADQWPIYARPLLFTEIDHETQIEFAQAMKARNEAYEISPKLKRVMESAIEKPSFFDIPDNIRVIKTGSEFHTQTESLAYKVIDLGKSILAIKGNQAKISQKRNLVRSNIKELKLSVEKAIEERNKLEREATGLVNLIDWSIQVAQDAHNSAELELKPKPNWDLEDDQGDLCYATADVYVVIGNIALKCFHLYVDSLKEIGRYELDLFMNLFQESTDHVKSILEISDISGWKKLRRAKGPIDTFPQKEVLAKKSLEDFRGKRILFETTEKRLSEVNWDERINRAKNIQSKCMRYWPAYHENKAEWMRILDNRILPETRFVQLRDQCISELLPETGSGVIIPQSKLPGLTSKMSEILEGEKLASDDTENLRQEYQRNWDAEEQVRALVTKDGEVYIYISQVHEIMDDTEDELARKGAILHDQYTGFINRINRVRGANFPELLEQCFDFVVECKNLTQSHQALVLEVETKYQRLVSSLQSSLSEIQTYIDMSPSLDQAQIDRLEEFETSCKPLLEKLEDKRYLSMRSLVGEMEEWFVICDPFVKKIRSRVENFKMLSNQTQSNVVKAKANISNHHARATRKTGWANEEMMAVIERASHQLEKVINAWDRYIELDWPEMSMREASSDCQKILREIDTITFELENELDKVNRELSANQKWTNEIHSRVAANMHQISEQDVALIDNLCQIGTRAPTREFAKRSLELAEELATESINTRLRRSAQITINDYKRTIHTGGGSYTEGDINIQDKGQYHN